MSDEKNPIEGGSYLRNKDGTLTRQSEPAPKPEPKQKPIEKGVE